MISDSAAISAWHALVQPHEHHSLQVVLMGWFAAGLVVPVSSRAHGVLASQDLFGAVHLSVDKLKP